MRPKLIALIAVSAVALVGCAGPESNAEPAGASSTPAAAPLIMSAEEAEASSPTVDPTGVAMRNEQAGEEFLKAMDPSFSGWTGELPAENELLSAAQLACEQLRGGTDFLDTEVIEGSVYEFSKEELKTLDASERDELRDTPLYANNKRIVNAARSTFCTDTLD